MNEKKINLNLNIKESLISVLYLEFHRYLEEHPDCSISDLESVIESERFFPKQFAEKLKIDYSKNISNMKNEWKKIFLNFLKRLAQKTVNKEETELEKLQKEKLKRELHSKIKTPSHEPPTDE